MCFGASRNETLFVTCSWLYWHKALCAPVQAREPSLVFPPPPFSSWQKGSVSLCQESIHYGAEFCMVTVIQEMHVTDPHFILSSYFLVVSFLLCIIDTLSFMYTSSVFNLSYKVVIMF